MFGSMIRVLKSVSLAAGFVAAFASTSSANQFRVTEVALVAQRAAHNGACPVTIAFVGRIKATGRGRVAYTKNVSASSSRVLGGVRAIARPDLIVHLQAPHVAFAGQDISALMRLFARNIGAAPAPGTNGVINPAAGYMIDVVLSRDGNVPAGFAVFSPNFVEDALLRGGRRSNTADLAPGATRVYPGQGVIPADTPTGNYFLCARIDPGNRVTESNELNNTACVQIHINVRQ